MYLPSETRTQQDLLLERYSTQQKKRAGEILEEELRHEIEVLSKRGLEVSVGNIHLQEKS